MLSFGRHLAHVYKKYSQIIVGTMAAIFGYQYPF